MEVFLYLNLCVVSDLPLDTSFCKSVYNPSLTIVSYRLCPGARKRLVRYQHAPGQTHTFGRACETRPSASGYLWFACSSSKQPIMLMVAEYLSRLQRLLSTFRLIPSHD
jgi:hypothetical protein